ncbi:hypothetical protein HII12_002503 [Brettanomyces bruxellensis]|uniref:Uncharacterized protein n=1 Tax=Dekkera bruxellensis TaxID=5007 RepID=A0A8H6BJ64_DEKBR|nr:hypothetical protein HII12_002503 [Brettanomyces bruxellensis]
MSSLMIAPPNLSLDSTDAEKILSTQNASMLLHLDLSTSDRLQFAKVFAIKGRKQAALREIATALKLASLKNKPQTLYEAATLLGSMGLSEQALYCCYEAKEQLKAGPPNKLLEVTFECIIKQITEDKINPFQEQTDKLTLLRKRAQNETRLLEKLTNILGDYRSINDNSYASNVVKWYAQYLSMDLKMQQIKDGATWTFLEREYFAKQLVLNISESVTSSAFYRNILNSSELEDNMILVRYGLSISNSKAKLMEHVNNLTELFNELCRNKITFQEKVSAYSFATQNYYLRGLRDYYNGDVSNALNSFQKISNFTMEWFFNQHIGVGLSRAEKEVQFSVEAISIKVASSSACFMLICILKMIRGNNLKEELDGYENSLETISKTINCIIYWSSQVGSSFNHIESYMALGKVHELLAILKSDEFHLQNELSSFRLALNKDHLEKAISSYQDALRFCCKDDPAKVRLYKRILWAILAHGGLKMSAFWVLKFVTDLSSLESDCSLISHEDQTSLNEDYFMLNYDATSNVEALTSLIYHQRTSLMSICRATSCKESGYHTSLPEFLLDPGCTQMYSKDESQNEAFSLMSPTFKGILKHGSYEREKRNFNFTNDIMKDAGIDKMSKKDKSGRIANFMNTYCTCKCQ